MENERRYEGFSAESTVDEINREYYQQRKHSTGSIQIDKLLDQIDAELISAGISVKD
jgi:hypothetical protein